MNCSKCGEKPIKVKKEALCSNCYNIKHYGGTLDDLKVSPCLGDCGRRVHNLRYVVVPGVVQGHGPGRAWCDGCRRKYRPKSTENPHKGPCAACEQPMMVGDLEPGTVQFWASGMCQLCYYRHGKPKSGRNGEMNGQAKLTEQAVRDIRVRYARKEETRAIAKLYGVHPYTVRKVANRKTWKHVN